MKYRTDVVEDILLIHTGIGAVLKSGEVAVVVHGGFFHPGVDRKGVQLVQTEQQKAVGDLASDAAQLHDAIACSVGVHGGKRSEIERAVTDGAGGGNQVGCAVSGAEKFQIIPLERLLREPFLSSPDQYIEPFLPPDTPRLEVTASDDGSILSMVAGGLGVSVLSAFSLVGYEGQVRVLQLEEPIALRLGAAVKSLNAAGTSARTFLSFLREYYEKNGTP